MGFSAIEEKAEIGGSMLSPSVEQKQRELRGSNRNNAVHFYASLGQPFSKQVSEPYVTVFCSQQMTQTNSSRVMTCRIVTIEV